MKCFSHTITDPDGFHVRLVGAFVKEAKKYPCAVTVEKNEHRVNAKNMFHVMELGIMKGETINIIVDGVKEEEAIAALEECLKAHDRVEL